MCLQGMSPQVYRSGEPGKRATAVQSCKEEVRQVTHLGQVDWQGPGRFYLKVKLKAQGDAWGHWGTDPVYS